MFVLVLVGRITVGFINLLKIGSLTVKVVDQGYQVLRILSTQNPLGPTFDLRGSSTKNFLFDAVILDGADCPPVDLHLHASRFNSGGEPPTNDSISSVCGFDSEKSRAEAVEIHTGPTYLNI